MTNRFIPKTLLKGFSPYYYLRKTVFNAVNAREYISRIIRSRRIDRNEFRTPLFQINTQGWTSLNVDTSVAQETADYCAKLEQENFPSETPPDTSQGKDFWRFIVNSESVKDHPKILAFARNRYFQDFASLYLGEEAILTDVTLMKSYPTGREAKHSQLWHLDADDTKLVVIYLYCRDVDQNNGPFVLAQKNKIKHIWSPKFLRKHTYDDQDFFRKFSPDSIETITGPKGTVFACDTVNNYHHGSRCTTKSRLALSFRYSTFSGLYPAKKIDS